MRVLFVAPYAVTTPHYETALELMQAHLDAGDQVVLMACNADMLTCDANVDHDLRVCAWCIDRRLQGLALLDGPVEVRGLYRLTDADREALAAVPAAFETLEALTAFAPDGLDLGYGVLSSVISAVRQTRPDPAEPRIARMIRRLLTTAYALYLTVTNTLREEDFGRVYVYNGRYAPARAVLRACQQAGVDCRLHETGSSVHHYALYENRLPHELPYADQLIREHWERGACDPVRREHEASAYYEQLSQGKVQVWFSYVTDQQPGLLPEGWDPTRKNIVIFNSSEDEFASISDEWRLPFYANQLDGLRRMLDDLAHHPEVAVYLRVHPNLRHVDDDFTRGLASLSGPNFNLIPSASAISSYALLFNATQVVTFGSTMGAEAAYWGKPSILAGVSMYRHLGSTYNPATHADLMTLLLSDLAPLPKTGALMYGYYLRTFGYRFTHFQADGVFGGRFKSAALRARWPARLLGRAVHTLGGDSFGDWWGRRQLGLSRAA